ncbi:MAG: hypothetical protein JO138_24560 [Acidobacteriaceae bacterium]|nr:hypothetical protein [Acidobacteriaceae bacterium]
MTQRVADVQLHSNLIDDYLHVKDAPAAPGPPGSFVAVRGGAARRADLLTIDSSKNLLHFAPVGTSASGWHVTHVQVPQPAGVTSGMFGTVSFYFGGALNAICLFNAPHSLPAVTPAAFTASWMWLSSDGTWWPVGLSDAAQSMLSLCTQLDHYTDNAGNVYVYGVVPPILGQLSAAPGSYLAPESATFFVIYFNTETKDWDVGYQCEVGSLNAKAPVTFQILSGGSGNPTILWIDPDSIQFQQASLSPSQGGFSWVGSLTTLPFGSVVINGVNQLIPFPGTSPSDVVLILDNSQTLWQAEFGGSFTSPFVPLTGIENAPAGATSAFWTLSVGGADPLPLFVVEAHTSNLWVSRGSKLPLKWVNLGNQVQAIAVPETVPAGLELFYVDMNGNVYYMSQNPGDTVWVTTKLAAPVPSSATPAPISSIAMHAAAVDGNGAPVANAIFTVTSDQWVNLIVNELSYWAGPTASAVFQADALGHAAAQFVASGLAMPKLTFSAVAPDSDPGDATAQRWCQGDVIEVKQNETPIPVSSSSMASRLAGKDPLCPVTEQSLESAGLLDPNFNGKSDAVKTITQIGQWMLAQNTPSEARSPLAARHWRFEFSSGNKSCREVASPPALEPALGNIFSDIFGDVVNWAKNAAGELTSLVISVGTTFKIAFNDAVTFTVSTVREAGEALEVVFIHIAQAVKDFIDIINDIIQFLRLLFGWNDILYTHRVLVKMVRSFLAALKSASGDLQPMLQQGFEDLQKKIQSELTNVDNNPSFKKSFNEYANSQPNSGSHGSNVLANPNGTNSYHQNLPRCLYVYNHAKGVSLGIEPGSIDISGITKAVSTVWSEKDVKLLQQKFLNYIQANHGGFGQLFDFGIAEIVSAIQELLRLAFAGAEAVLDAILDLIPAMITAFHGMFQSTINIPIISYIYNLLTGDDLTLLDLFCLICAVPVTILYKVLNNGNAPFASGDADKLVLPWPKANLVSRNMPGFQAPADVTIYQRIGVCGMALNLLNMFISAGCDAYAFGEPQGLFALFLSWTSNFLGFISIAVCAPWSTWIASRKPNAADIMTSVQWVLSGIPTIYDSLFALATEGLARFLAIVGPILDGCYGIFLLATGIATGVVQAVEGKAQGYTGWDAANSIVPTTNRPFRFLILVQDDPATPLAMAALLLIDMGVSAASAFTQYEAILHG